MAYTTPRTWADETIVNADDLNVEIRDNVSALYSMAAYPSRNMLYNGAMQFAQRSSSVPSITTSGYYTADRWQSVIGTLGTWTQSVENDAPNSSGIRKSLKMLCTTAKATPLTTDAAYIQQQLEGQDVQRIAKGTSNAQTITLSFWVKSNVVGTYICGLYDLSNTRIISRSYTISSSATWEQKFITFSADTSGVLNNDNAAALIARFYLAVGPSLSSGTLQTTWGTDVLANSAVGQTNLASAINNYWQVTGIQMETGSVATPYEFLSYGDELRRCQRYYETSGLNVLSVIAWSGSNDSASWYPFVTSKRAAPVLSGGGSYNGGVSGTFTLPTNATAFLNGFYVSQNVAASSGKCSVGYGINWTASAEL